MRPRLRTVGPFHYALRAERKRTHLRSALILLRIVAGIVAKPANSEVDS